MWHLKIQEDGGGALDWLIPLPGEFHFTWHCAQALYKLWWLQLLAWAAASANMTKSMKAPNEMDCTDNIKYIDHFMQLMIAAIARHLCDLFGTDYLLNVPYGDLVAEWTPKSLGVCALIHLIEFKVHLLSCTGLLVLLKFLHDFAFPWLSLRMGVRGNADKPINFMWNFSMPWFRATNKTNYAAMTVNVGLLHELMGATFKNVWREYRTASFLGRAGRNVAWDYVLERMNRDFKQYLGHHVTEDRLNSFAVMLNGLKHVKRMVSNAWGLDRFDVEYEYTHVLADDVDNLVAEMKSALGNTLREVELRGGANRNPFRTNARATTMPWRHVENIGKHQLDEYIRRHCTMRAAW